MLRTQIVAVNKSMEVAGVTEAMHGDASELEALTGSKGEQSYGTSATAPRQPSSPCSEHLQRVSAPDADRKTSQALRARRWRQPTAARPPRRRIRVVPRAPGRPRRRVRCRFWPVPCLAAPGPRKPGRSRSSCLRPSAPAPRVLFVLIGLKEPRRCQDSANAPPSEVEQQPRA